jgi:hydrogenase maturation protease
MHERGKVLVLGIGNDFRGDDAAGLEVARRIRRLDRDDITVHENTGDIATMIDAWQQYDAAVVVDATQSGSPPGTITRFDPAVQPIPNVFVSHVSSHGAGVAEAVALAEALDQLPPRLAVWGIEGQTFSTIVGLSPAVASAVAAIVPEIAAAIDAGLMERKSNA